MQERKKGKNSMSAPLALFAAESRGTSRRYIHELEELGFEVVFCSNADGVFDGLGAERKPVLIVTAGNLPPGRLFRHHGIAGGFKMGLVLYKKIRKEHPTLPVIVITCTEDILEELKLNPDPKMGIVDRMPDTTYREFAGIVSKLTGIS